MAEDTSDSGHGQEVEALCRVAHQYRSFQGNINAKTMKSRICRMSKAKTVKVFQKKVEIDIGSKFEFITDTNSERHKSLCEISNQVSVGVNPSKVNHSG